MGFIAGGALRTVSGENRSRYWRAARPREETLSFLSKYIVVFFCIYLAGSSMCDRRKVELEPRFEGEQSVVLDVSFCRRLILVPPEYF